MSTFLSLDLCLWPNSLIKVLTRKKTKNKKCYEIFVEMFLKQARYKIICMSTVGCNVKQLICNFLSMNCCQDESFRTCLRNDSCRYWWWSFWYHITLNVIFLHIKELSWNCSCLALALIMFAHFVMNHYAGFRLEWFEICCFSYVGQRNRIGTQNAALWQRNPIASSKQRHGTAKLIFCLAECWLIVWFFAQYLACLSTSSSNDKLSFDVGLQEHSHGEACWWTVHPASKQR